MVSETGLSDREVLIQEDSEIIQDTVILICSKEQDLITEISQDTISQDITTVNRDIILSREMKDTDPMTAVTDQEASTTAQVEASEEVQPAEAVALEAAAEAAVSDRVEDKN